MLGGAANFFQRVRDGMTEKWSVFEFIGELVISAFTGIVTFYLCEAADLPPLVTAAFVGISGHMGSRAIMILENYLKRKFL